MRRLCASLLALTVASPAWATGVSMRAIENMDWQKPFAGAVRWSTLGVHADSGVTVDNVAALNALPGGTPIIGDCPGGGFIQMSSGWTWPNNFMLWVQPGCVVESTNTNTTLNIVMTPFSATAISPVTGVKIYGLNLDCLIPTHQMRSMRLWLNHSDIQHTNISNCGGQTGRFGDSYFAFNNWKVAPQFIYPTFRTGNPGLRMLGNDLVALSPGMPKSFWMRYGFVESGDAALQTCQPTPTPGVWTYGASTDSVLYQNIYFHASTGILAGLQNTPPSVVPYHCQDMHWDNITGSGTYLGFIPPGRLGESFVNNVSFTNIDFTKILSGAHGTLGVGQVGIGGSKQYTSNQLENVLIDNVTIRESFRRTLDNEGCMIGPIVIKNSSFAGRDKNIYAEPTVKNDGTCNILMKNNIISASDGGDAIQDGVSTQSVGNTYTDNIISGVPDGQSGYNLINTNVATINGGSVTPAFRSVVSVGVTLTTNPNGTLNSQVHGVDLTAMPAPAIICAPGQGNNVTSNPGAPDCAR